MQVRIVRNLGRDLPDYTEGQVVDVEQADAIALIGQGLAVAIDAPFRGVAAEPEIKGVPPVEPAEGTVEKATVDLQSYADKAKGKKKNDS